MTKYFRKTGTEKLSDVYNIRIIIQPEHWKHFPALSERLFRMPETSPPHSRKHLITARKSLFGCPEKPLS
ncbi:hypothetical protein QVN81_00370 [Prevotella lascolaii]|uniref:Uncharacterized protein n=1 Tax=Leyella lascolaii TaxID=1776379 RepID=A0AAW7JSY2_9BACT|nr:hypothetical protein [Leyella lascolaii]MDN0021484.1 hypothetical protein [Leyella lascolaii]MDN0023981.1 hypothetical protein [Leyella lascolaii]